MPRLAASIAYATIFALAPLLIVLIAILGLLVGNRSVEDSLMSQISAHAGVQAGLAMRDLVASQFNRPREGVIAQVIGWIVFIAGASGLFGALQDGLNAIWNVERTKGGWTLMLRERLASFGMMAVLGFVLLVSFAANAAIAYISAHYVRGLSFAGSPLLLSAVNAVINVAVTAATLAALYKLLPSVAVRWRDAWRGGITTAVLFVIGEALLSIYMAKAGVVSGYGAAGALLAVLVWVYYSAMMLLIGAEYMKVRTTGVRTKAQSTIREASEVPAGVDPRRG